MTDKSLPSLEALIASLESAEKNLKQIMGIVTLSTSEENPVLDSVSELFGHLAVDVMNSRSYAQDHLMLYQHERMEQKQTHSAIEALINKGSRTITHDKITDRIQALVEYATTDALSGLYNKRAFNEKMEELVENVAKPRRRSDDTPYRTDNFATFGLAILDIDHFKQINDQRGHPTGDMVIGNIGALLKSNIRGTDDAYRVGGEEFALVFPIKYLETGDRPKARDVEKNLYRRLEGIRGAVENSLWIPDYRRVTISAGIAAYEPGQTIEAIYQAADRALYRSKEGGRNRVTCATYIPNGSGPVPSLTNGDKSAPYSSHAKKDSKK